jgi:putative ABC transport system permease protein
MNVLRFKILRDLWVNRTRTIQVMLIIGISSAAIGMILGTRNLVVPGMQEIWTSAHPAMINFFIDKSITEDDVTQLGKTPGVTEIEAFNNATIEWRLKPGDEWQQGGLTAKEDYKTQEMNKLDLLDGKWPFEKVAAVGQDGEKFFKIPKGATVYFRVNDKIYTVKTDGEIYDQLIQPATFGGMAQFYVSQDEYGYLIGDTLYSRIMVRAAQYDEKQVTALADKIGDRLQKMGRESGRLITDPNKHFFQDSMDGIFMLLGVLGVLSLILGLLLVYNTISSIIAAQTDQIGIMKAIGARTGNILGFYLTVVFIYGLLALAVSLPLGILGAWATSKWLVGSFGANLGSFQLSQQAIIVQSIIALFAPLLVALIPIGAAARITVREAIGSYGLSAKTGLLERALTKIKFLSRLVLLTVSNTFRHKWRVILLELSLVLSALVFMMVISVRDSVTYTVRDVMFSILNANITLLFKDTQRIDYVENLTTKYPGIKAVEMWGFYSGTIRLRGTEYSKDDKAVTVMGVPLPTKVYGYQLISGRWLDPRDERAIVINTRLAKDAKINLGDWVTIRYGPKNERDFQVVGMDFDPIMTNSGLVRRDIMLNDLGQVDQAGAIWIKTEQGGADYEAALAKSLRTYYDKNNVKVSAQRGIFGMGGDSTAQTASALISQFNFLVVLLGIMAVVIGAVGSIALSGALALSVTERRREIGVMRAIGASSWTIFRLFIGEGLILGWLSWLVALPVSIPAGRLMVQALGKAFGLDILYKFQPTGAIMWFVIITILSILASWLPARGATRISVRESLAYQ